jgi:hypothetical protein
VDISIIASTISSIKTSGEILKSLRELNKGVEVNEKIIALQTEILSLQGNFLQFQASYAELNQENQELKRKLIEKLEWEVEKTSYVLKNLEDDRFVYEPITNGAVKHWLCVTCFEKRKKSILQKYNSGHTHDYYRCHECSYEMIVSNGGIRPSYSF